MEPNGSLIGNASTSVTNLQKDFLQLGNVVENTVLPKVRSLVDALNDASDRAANILGGSTGAGGAGSGKNKIAPNGVTRAAIGNGAGGNDGTPPNSVADNGTKGNGGMPGAVAAAYGVQAFRAMSNSLPNTNTAVMQDFLTQRSAFFGQGGYSGSLQDQTGGVRSLQKMMARMGVANGSMDTTNALAALQPLGYAKNFGAIAQGVATASNFTPGIGQTAIAQAVSGTMNAPTTINLARTIGINIRDAQGNVMPPDKLADQIWSYITRYNGGKALTKQQIQMSLAPGNGLYGMLMGLFSNDPTMFTIISNMLIGKAQFGGQAAGSISKDQLVTAGGMSATVRNMASQTAAQTNLLTSTASAQAGGYAGAADVGAGMNNLASAMSDLTAVLGGGKGLLGGIAGLGGGAVGKIGNLGLGLGASKLLGKTSLGKKGLGSLFGGALSKILPAGLAEMGIADLLPLLFLEKGGPADAKQPYIVGEVGPELFVPKTDGYVIPNSALNTMHRDKGGDVKAFESNFFKDISAPNTAANRTTLEQWMRYEKGNNTMLWNNPLNSELRMSGSTSANKAGVQKYKTVAQGAQADASTLINTKGVGYDKILNAFRSGQSADEIWSSIVQSGWVTGKVDPNRKKYASGSGSSASGSSSSSFTPVTSNVTANSQRQALTSLLSSAFGGQSSGMAMPSSNSYNYGGVSITIQADKNPQATADAIKKALQTSTTVKAVGSN